MRCNGWLSFWVFYTDRNHIQIKLNQSSRKVLEAVVDKEVDEEVDEQVDEKVDEEVDWILGDGERSEEGGDPTLLLGILCRPRPLPDKTQPKFSRLINLLLTPPLLPSPAFSKSSSSP